MNGNYTLHGVNSKSNVQPQSLILNSLQSFLIHGTFLFAGSSLAPTSGFSFIPSWYGDYSLLSSLCWVFRICWISSIGTIIGQPHSALLHYCPESFYFPFFALITFHYGTLLSRSRKPLQFCLIKPLLCSDLHPTTWEIIGTLKFQPCFLSSDFCKGQAKCLSRAPTLLSRGKASMGPWLDEEPRSDRFLFLSLTSVVFNSSWTQRVICRAVEILDSQAMPRLIKLEILRVGTTLQLGWEPLFYI